MSQPNIPNITPNVTITREDAVNLVLSSIAMEEMGMSHILNAEGEKLQYVLGTLPGLSGPPATIEDILAVNKSVKGMVDSITRNEMMLQHKLETITSIPLSVGPTGPQGPAGEPGELSPDTVLFNVVGGTGSVEMTPGEDLIFKSNTLDISVERGSAIVNLELPQGPSPDTILPFPSAYVYIFSEYSYFYDSTVICPNAGTIKRLLLTFALEGFNIEPNETATISYELVVTPVDNSSTPYTHSGSFSPTISDSMSLNTILVVDESIQMVTTAPTMISVKNLALNATGTSNADVSGHLYGVIIVEI